MSGKARFIRWQLGYDDIPTTPLFTIIESGEMSAPVGATVSGETLLDHYKIPLPLFPGYDAWRLLVISKLKCGRCFRTLRGTVADYNQHLAMKHCEHPHRGDLAHGARYSNRPDATSQNWRYQP